MTKITVLTVFCGRFLGVSEGLQRGNVPIGSATCSVGLILALALAERGVR
jgi:hypothetical protein